MQESKRRGGPRRGNRMRAGGRPQGGRRPFHASNGRNRTRQKRVRKTFDVSQYINKNPVQTEPEKPYVPTLQFAELSIDGRIKRAIKDMGFGDPSPIQDQIIPHIIDGKDVIGLANTGTGKTAAFLIPLIDAALKEDKRQTLILTPTRELAIQIQDELRKLTKHARLFSTVCVGGANIRPQIQGLKRKNHFIVGTPGRVIDLIDRGKLQPQKITTVVLDEADRMLDMGFIHDMKKILEDIPKERHTLFFSATMSPQIEKLVHEFLTDPVTVSVKKKDTAASIVQDVISHDKENKFETLTELLGNEKKFDRVLIFGAMKHSVDKLGKSLTQAGIPSESIHGNKSHSARQHALKNFKSGRVRVLVATDVAARGIHVDDVSHVINYDLPGSYEDYVHRIGRTGRGGKNGQALTFVPERSVQKAGRRN